MSLPSIQLYMIHLLASFRIPVDVLLSYYRPALEKALEKNINQETVLEALGMLLPEGERIPEGLSTGNAESASEPAKSPEKTSQNPKPSLVKLEKSAAPRAKNTLVAKGWQIPDIASGSAPPSMGVSIKVEPMEHVPAAARNPEFDDDVDEEPLAVPTGPSPRGHSPQLRDVKTERSIVYSNIHRDRTWRENGPSPPSSSLNSETDTMAPMQMEEDMEIVNQIQNRDFELEDMENGEALDAQNDEVEVDQDFPMDPRTLKMEPAESFLRAPKEEFLEHRLEEGTEYVVQNEFEDEDQEYPEADNDAMREPDVQMPRIFKCEPVDPTAYDRTRNFPLIDIASDDEEETMEEDGNDDEQPRAPRVVPEKDLQDFLSQGIQKGQQQIKTFLLEQGIPTAHVGDLINVPVEASTLLNVKYPPQESYAKLGEWFLAHRTDPASIPSHNNRKRLSTSQKAYLNEEYRISAELCKERRQEILKKVNKLPGKKYDDKKLIDFFYFKGKKERKNAQKAKEATRQNKKKRGVKRVG